MSLTLSESRPTDVAAQQRQLAIFDLDGTLVRGDTFVPFLVSYAWSRRKLLPLFVLPWHVLLYCVRLATAQKAKERLLRAFFRGESMASISRHAEWFCVNKMQSRLRPNVVERLQSHQASGDRVILLSASPDLYVPAIGRFLGIVETICTRVKVVDGVCEGSIVGANCKGPEKIRALKRHLDCDDSPKNSVAYGDSRSDLPLLRWVSEGYLVSRDGLSSVHHDSA